MKDIICNLLICFPLFLPMGTSGQHPTLDNLKSLSEDISKVNIIAKNKIPIISDAYFDEDDLKNGNAEKYIDFVNNYTVFNWLLTKVKGPGISFTDVDVFNGVSKVVKYAKEKGIRMSIQLDPRLKIKEFREKYPDELQESLWLKEIELNKESKVNAVVKSIELADHMGVRGVKSNRSVRGDLVRVYLYEKSAEGIIVSESIKDISRDCKMLYASPDSVRIEIPSYRDESQLFACVMVSFTRLAPAIFAPHLTVFPHNPQ